MSVLTYSYKYISFITSATMDFNQFNKNGATLRMYRIITQSRQVGNDHI